MTFASANGRPAICSASGSPPWVKPLQTTMLGPPVTLNAVWMLGPSQERRMDCRSNLGAGAELIVSSAS
jgi:hypothetical protein